MDNLSGIGGERMTFFPIFFGNHCENIRKLCKGFFPGGHKGIAPGDGGNFGYPGPVLLPVQNCLIVTQIHITSPCVQKQL